MLRSETAPIWISPFWARIMISENFTFLLILLDCASAECLGFPHPAPPSLPCNTFTRNQVLSRISNTLL